MDFNFYQQQAATTATYPQKQAIVYLALGINGEAGEVAEKIKKVIRDEGGVISYEKKLELVKELGDVLWYVSEMARQLDVNLENVAETNLVKLFSRKNRDVLGGSGDNR